MKVSKLLMILVLAVPSAAMAEDECASDSDCPWGFQCTDVKLPCATTPGCEPCTCACPADGECPPCQCDPCPEPEPCQEQTVKACTYDPAECSNDGDCVDGFECVEVKSCWGGGCACPSCTCPVCPDGMDCPPCDCPEVMECDCNPDDFEEHCEVEGAWCMPKEKTCAADKDCPDGWECVESPTPCACEQCMCPEIVCAPDADCPDIQPCDCPPCQCDNTDQKNCLPAGWSKEGYAGTESSPDGAFATLSGAKDDGSGSNAQNPPAQTPDDAAASTAANSCQAGARPSSGAVFLLLALLAGLWLFGRRGTAGYGR
ncbi:MAG: hypothetical protein GXP54_11610 [Deltaproteobacteria bacterium]|nr:hypothetical protein [Deltaproteobacteria bacterium]